MIPGNESRFINIEPEIGKTAYQIPLTDPDMELVDVSTALLDPNRRVYSKMGKEAKLDSLLGWRLALKEAEEKNQLKFDVTPPLSPGVVNDKDQEEEQKRVYSNTCTSGPVALRRLLVDDDPSSSKATKKAPVKYPMLSSYTTKSKKRSIFVLPDDELRHLARQYGQERVQGFNHNSRNKTTTWIYPTSRPLFKTCWFYRTNGLQTLSAAALQLRILWACLRWDEMDIRSGPSAKDKSQLKSEEEPTLNTPEPELEAPSDLLQPSMTKEVVDDVPQQDSTTENSI